MFSYETNNEAAKWGFILFCFHLFLFICWGFYGDNEATKFYARHLRNRRDDEYGTGFMCFGMYTVFSILFWILFGAYFTARNAGENERREQTRYQEIYNQGMDAAENGIPDSACPYRKSGGKYASASTDERKWLEGWIAKKTQMNKEQQQ